MNQTDTLTLSRREWDEIVLPSIYAYAREVYACRLAHDDLPDCAVVGMAFAMDLANNLAAHIRDAIDDPITKQAEITITHAGINIIRHVADRLPLAERIFGQIGHRPKLGLRKIKP